jgi:hypothetical protein
MQLGEARHGDLPLPYGGRLSPGCGNLMVERSVFQEVGVFQRTVSGRGEDTDLFSRLERAGIVGWYFPTAIVQHLTPPERLKAEYLLSLASRMGEGVALRHAAHQGRGQLAALCLAKAIRAALLQWPLLTLARVRGDAETALGRRCLLEINRSLLRKSRELLRTTQVQANAASMRLNRSALHSPSHS